MQILEIDGTTRVLGESQGYRGLPVKDCEENGVKFMQSEWALTDEEAAALKSGATIILTVVGEGHPPVKLEVKQ